MYSVCFVLMIACFVCLSPGSVFAQNLIRSGDFQSLTSWESNETLRKFGEVKPLPDDRGVLIRNSRLNEDASLHQTVSADGSEWFSVSVRIKHGANTGSALALVALDASGRELRTFVPFKIGHWESTRWDEYQKTINVPPKTRALRVELTVLDGSCSFSEVTLRPVPEPRKTEPRMELLKDQGFTVERLPAKRPLWEIFVDDLDGDGQAELVACDVDGLVTAGKPGEPPYLIHEPGALIYQFESADLNSDGVKEILMTSVNPRVPMKAIDLQGKVVRTFPQVKGHQRIAVADMNGDGRPEVAAGVPGGVALFDADGNELWEIEYRLSEFHFGEVPPGPGPELVVGYGGPRTQFQIHDFSGRKQATPTFDDRRRIFPEHFAIADVDSDGAQEIIVFRSNGSLLCLRDGKLVWQNTLPSGLQGEFGLLKVGNFCPSLDGLETVLIGTHAIFVFDARGSIVYRSSEARRWMPGYWDQWIPGGIHPLSAALWNPDHPDLYLSSSTYRDPAFYRLRFGEKDELANYRLPDREQHLDAIYADLKERPALPSTGEGKFRVVYTRNWGTSSEERLRDCRKVFDGLETPRVEFTLMYDPSDLKAHPRGTKMTTDQIVERARLFERLQLPFGYFAVHGCQVWLSDEAILRSIEAAPTTFRFLYVAENFEVFYRSEYRPFLDWCERMLDLCSRHGLKLLFKEKHDVWGLLAADQEFAAKLFKPGYRDVIVPIYSTNQVYQPEMQWSGLLGLKLAGWCSEFGMSTQWWNWHEWKVRDLDAAYACPSDITLRLELLGAALGGTWFHIEGGQPYLHNDPDQGFVPLVTRHRDLVYELMRKNVLTPETPLANVNRVALARSLHPEFERAKAEERQIVYSYFARNVGALRKGFIPATHMFEPYLPYSFPLLAYGSAWNGITCFPRTPHGWIPVVPPDARLSTDSQVLMTDGEKVRLSKDWESAEKASGRVQELLTQGARNIRVQAPGTCLVVRGPLDQQGKRYRAILIDPGYLAPQGVKTVLRVPDVDSIEAADLVTGEELPCVDNTCTIQISPGAFRAVDVVISD